MRSILTNLYLEYSPIIAEVNHLLSPPSNMYQNHHQRASSLRDSPGKDAYNTRLTYGNITFNWKMH